MTATLPYPILDDDPGHNDHHSAIHELLQRLDGQNSFLVTGLLQGLLSGRPSAAVGNRGLFHYATDTPGMAYSDGSAWKGVALLGEAASFTDDVFFNSGKPWYDALAEGSGIAGDGTTDDGADGQTWITAHPQAVLFFPKANYKLTAQGWAFTDHQEVYFANATITSAFAGTVLRMASNTIVHGKVKVAGSDVSNSVGVRFGGTSSNCQRAYAEWLWVTDMNYGVLFESDGTNSCYYNVIGTVRANGCTYPIVFRTTAGAVAMANANYIDHAFVDGNTRGILVDLANGNGFGYLELETNASENGYYALDLVRALGFYVRGGWSEGNVNADATRRSLRIANDPDVQNVDIYFGSSDMVASVSADFSHTHSNNRSVVVSTSVHMSVQQGRFSTAAIHIGVRGTASDDQSVVDRCRISGGIYGYRVSAASPYFRVSMPTNNVGLSVRDDTDGASKERLRVEHDTGMADGALAGMFRRNVGGVFSLVQLKFGANGTGPGGTGRAIYVDA